MRHLKTFQFASHFNIFAVKSPYIYTLNLIQINILGFDGSV